MRISQESVSAKTVQQSIYTQKHAGVPACFFFGGLFMRGCYSPLLKAIDAYLQKVDEGSKDEMTVVDFADKHGMGAKRTVPF